MGFLHLDDMAADPIAHSRKGNEHGQARRAVLLDPAAHAAALRGHAGDGQLNLLILFQRHAVPSQSFLLYTLP